MYKDRPYPQSRLGGSRGCLCKDKNTYSRKCCDGSMWSQGIGKTRGTN